MAMSDELTMTQYGERAADWPRRTCGECSSFIGGSDWGLSCAAYYMRIVDSETDASRCPRFHEREVPRVCR